MDRRTAAVLALALMCSGGVGAAEQKRGEVGDLQGRPGLERNLPDTRGSAISFYRSDQARGIRILADDLQRLKTIADKYGPAVSARLKSRGASVEDLQTKLGNAARSSRTTRDLGTRHRLFTAGAETVRSVVGGDAVKGPVLGEALAGAQAEMAGAFASKGLAIAPSPTGLALTGDSRKNSAGKTAPPPPTPSSQQLTFAPPYDSDGVTGAMGESQADRNRGRVEAGCSVDIAGSLQSVAFVLVNLDVPAGVRTIRVTADVDGECELGVAGCLGYASAEAIVNARLLNGPQQIAEGHVSIDRDISAVLGFPAVHSSVSTSVAFRYTRPDPGQSARYSLVGDIECWAGCGGFYHADASGHATYPRFVVVYER